jgi:hypothetical protein
MNNRPITRVSDDIKDLEALMPNHILLLRDNPSMASGEFKKIEKSRKFMCQPSKRDKGGFNDVQISRKVNLY